MKKGWKLAVPLLASVTLLASCGNNGNNSNKSSSNKASTTNEMVKVKDTIERKGKEIKGGTLKYAIVSDSPIKGILCPSLYQDGTDADVLQFMEGELFTKGDDLHWTNDGFAKQYIDPETKTVKVTFPKDAKWSDGKPMTIDDYIFTHEFIANKDYPGVRYPSYVGAIEGAEEYHQGKSDHISGIEKVDDQTVILHYKEMTPSIKIAGGSLLGQCIPKHIFEKIPMDKVMESDAARKNPVGFGPYKLESMIPGESFTFVRNEYYYAGKPTLNKVIAEVVSSKNIVSEMENGNYDIAGMPSDKFDSYQNAKAFDILGTKSQAWNYIAFKFGKWDKDKGEVAPDPDAKMNNKSLRQAMAMAVDNDLIAAKFYKGTRTGGNSLIPPFFAENNGQEPIKFDPEGAKKLLDQAGYKDKDGDGFREDPNGKKLVIHYATMAGGENDQTLSLAYIKWWNEIGLDVKLTSGRPIELNSFYDKVEHDDKDIDLYAAAWGSGNDPDPTGFWGRRSQFNMSRYASEENDRLLADISSQASFDDKHRMEAFDKWQRFTKDECYAFPTAYKISLTAVNKRIKYFDVKKDNYPDKGSWENITFVQKDRVK
ncbi:oligopeptide ABC transporter substrate-binding protein [Atopobacter sp. AH10]|uniref:oligopeptide ABC transporter substrate-binding protein n=1 Tax=Atopobacter sp. AH10 TaxID=2315861 RepID=UPI000EF244C9|nr:oligopeptide ABC transporter substrate-binding protein [Atopobacter sp. AH10]RLK64280.1 oligopeptide ABC transporter substrate-binding protein [Atopobacter sp. AH10]